jgi:hypothetical protein
MGNLLITGVHQRGLHHPDVPIQCISIVRHERAPARLRLDRQVDLGSFRDYPYSRELPGVSRNDRHVMYDLTQQTELAMYPQ